MELAGVFVAAMVAFSPHTSTRVAEAYIRQARIDECVSRYEQRLFTQDQREVIGSLAAITRIAVERRVQVEWRIP